jgi:hypothetical protein
LLLAPLIAALTMMVVIAKTPAPHTGLIVATAFCMIVVLAGLAPLTFKSRG